jgi:hypothetical protein
MNNGRKKRFDVVMVWRFDRFAQLTKLLLLHWKSLNNWALILSPQREYRYKFSKGQ